VRDVQAARGKAIGADQPVDEPVDEDESGRGRPTGQARTRSTVILLGVAVVCWAVDQLTKAIVVARLDPADPVRLLGGLLTLRLVRNPGAAFSLGEDYTIVFTLLSAAVLAFVLIFLMRRVAHTGWAVALGLLSAGILGNLTDRVLRPPSPLHGHVVDFLQLPYWAIFNVADMCVVTAAVMIMVLSVVKNITLDGEPAGQPASRATSQPAVPPGEPAQGEP